MPFALTITGPSGSGKSTVLTQIREAGKKLGLDVHVVKRYTTRERRADDGADLDIVSQIPRQCDLVYEQYGVRYGLKSSSIFDALAARKTPIVIVNDIRTVADVKKMLGPLARAFFLFRSSPSLDEGLKLAYARAVANPEKDAERRFLKANAIYRIYIENIQLFDHVIVNAGSLADLHRQVNGVVCGLAGAATQWPLKRRPMSPEST